MEPVFFARDIGTNQGCAVGLTFTFSQKNVSRLLHRINMTNGKSSMPISTRTITCVVVNSIKNTCTYGIHHFVGKRSEDCTLYAEADERSVVGVFMACVHSNPPSFIFKQAWTYIADSRADYC